MDVWSPSAVPVGILWWNGPTRRLTIIAKMTLVPKNGALVLADEHEPLRTTIPSTYNAAQELHYPSDFVPFKRRCDVLVVGSAYSSAPQASIPFYFRVGNLERRVYALAGQPSNTIPLSSTYLRSEPTYNAQEVAVGPLSVEHAHRAAYVDPRVPTRASAFEQTTLPADFDGQCFQTAPLEQQIDPIAPGTALLIPWQGAEPQNQWIPPMRPRIFLFDQTTDSGLREVAMNCDTLWIDTDRSRMELTFRGVIDPVYGGQFPTAVVAVFASIYDAVLAGAATMICAQATIRKATEPRALEEPLPEPARPQQSTRAPSGARTTSSQDEEGTSVYAISALKASLPFASSPQPRSKEEATILPDFGARAPILPFVKGASALAAMSDSTVARAEPETDSALRRAPALPFVQAPRPPVAAQTTGARPEPKTVVPGVTFSAPALPFVPASRAPDAWPESRIAPAGQPPPLEATSRSALPFVSNEPRKRPSTLPPAASFAADEYDRPSVPPAQALPFVSNEYDRPSAPPPQALPFVSNEYDRPSAPPPQALPFVSSDHERPAAPSLQALPFVSSDVAQPPLARFDAQSPAGLPFPAVRPAPPPRTPEPPPLDTSALMRISLDTFAEIKVDLWSGVGLREALAKHGIDQRSYHLYERRQTDELGDDVRQGALDRTRALRAALRRARERRGPFSTDDGIL